MIVTALGFSKMVEDLEEKGLPYPFGEIFDEEDEVERDGYRSTEQQVNELLFAGEKLRAYRAELYSFPDGKDDGYMPERISDLVDGQRLADAIRARQEKKLKAAEEVAALKKKEEDDAKAKDAEELKAYREKAKSSKSEA